MADYYLLVDDFPHEGYALVKDKNHGLLSSIEWIIDSATIMKETIRFTEGALRKDKIMGWLLLNTAGKRISDYHDRLAIFELTTPLYRPW